MTNSDPEVLRFFVEFLRQYFDVPDDQFAVTCNLFADHLARQREVEHSGSTPCGCRPRRSASRS